MDLDIRHDEQQHKFFVPLDGGEARLEYEQPGEDVLDYRSTFVPEEHRERGIGGELVRHAMDYARREGSKVIPTCPFVSSWLEEHPEYQDLVAKAESRR